MTRHAELSEAATTTPRGARHFVRESLGGYPGTTVDGATQLVYEIVTLSMATSGASAVRINVEQSPDAVRVEVHEPPRRPDHRRSSDVADMSEEILDSVTDRWGIDDSPAGRVVWFELEVDRAG